MTFFMRLENCCVKCRTSSGNIPLAFPQGRHMNGNTFKRKKEIGSEPLLGDHCF